MSYSEEVTENTEYCEVFVINDEQHKFRIFAKKVTRYHDIDTHDGGYFYSSSTYYEKLSDKVIKKRPYENPKNYSDFLDKKRIGEFNYLSSSNWNDFLIINPEEDICISLEEIAAYYQELEKNGQMEEYISYIRSLAYGMKSKLVQIYNSFEDQQILQEAEKKQEKQKEEKAKKLIRRISDKYQI